MMHVSLLIPVFNAPDKLIKLWNSLISNTDMSLVVEILIGDDASDSFTEELIQSFQSDKLRVIRSEKNRGFVQNINTMFEQTQGEIVILINSDVVLPPGWLKRMIEPFILDDRVALATPFATNAQHLTVLPAEGESWLDVDRIYAQSVPKFPDAHTAVGYCLAIRRSSIGFTPLFDPEFGLGYGEETNLHFVLKKAGYRSVVVDNLLVHHAHGSSSFAQIDSVDERKKSNYQLFMKRWQKAYQIDDRAYRSVLPYANRRDELDHRNNHHYVNVCVDVLFVIPGLTPGIGGINVILALAERLNDKGIRCGLYCYGPADMDYLDRIGTIAPWLSESMLKYHVSAVQYVVASSWDSVSFAHRIARYYQSELGYLVQGFESLFENGSNFMQVVDDYKTVSRICCVSEKLRDFVLTACVPEERVSLCHMGPSQYRFYPSPEIKRQSKTIAACLRDTSAKGTPLALYALYWAQKQGFEIHLFGSSKSSYDFKSRAVYHGDLTPDEMRRLFSSVQFYLDLSLAEGLGLLPMEAAFCGAIPLLSHTGGSDSVFTGGINAIFIDNVFDSQMFFARLYEWSEADLKKISKGAQEIRYTRSEEIGFQDFLDHVHDSISKKGTSQISARERVVYQPSKSLRWCAVKAKESLGPDGGSNWYKAAYEETIRSASWRITAPLRKIVGWLRRR